MTSPSDVFVAQFREAAGWGAILELKIRLLYGKMKEIQPSIKARLENVEEEISHFFAKYLSEEEITQLRLCRQLRNKVLHCDFSKARKKLHEMGEPRVGGGVRKIDLSDTNGKGILEKIMASASNEPGAHQNVADLNKTDAADVFGWLLELGNAKDFIRAAEVFRRACEIIDRLATVDHKN